MQTQTVTVGDKIANRYEIMARIGAGGFGAVYRARQLDLNREVAIKTMLPHLAEVEGVEERFRREAELASALSSPHTIRLYDFGKTPGGMLYMVMELLEGRELAKALKADGPMPPALVKKITLEILDSLDEAHEHGVVHRDLKPSNIFLARQRRDENFVKVLDFGIAKAVSNEGNPEAQQLTATGQALGTPYYMSPEQIRGKNVGGYSDLYSLGLMMIEMLTGRIAMQGETPLDTVLLHVSDKPVPMPPWLAESPLGRVIARATAKSFQHRYPSADVMIAELRAADVSALGNAAASAGAWTPVNQPFSGIVDSGAMPQLQSGQIAARSGAIPNSALHTPYPASGLHTPQPGALHTPQPGMMAGHHPGMPGHPHGPMLHSQEFAQPHASGGRGKLVLLALIVLAVLIVGGVAAFVLSGSGEDTKSSGGGDREASAAAPPETRAADPIEGLEDDESFGLEGAETQDNTDDTAAAGSDESTPPTTASADPETPPPASDDTAAAGSTEGSSAETTTTAEVETVSVTIESTPPGADVKRGGQVLGQTPYSFEEPRADGKLELVLSRKDYSSKTVEVDLQKGGVLVVELDKASSSKRRTGSSSSTTSTGGAARSGGESASNTTTSSSSSAGTKKSDGDGKKSGGGSLAVPD